MLVSSYDFGGTDPEEVNINCTNVRLNDNHHSNGRAFGNDDSVYITVEAGNVDMSATGKDDAITEVSGLYTGVQDVDIELTEDLQADVAEGSVFTLKDKDDYIIASIVLGEAQGSTANYAFILSEAKSEGIDNGEYMWEFEAVMNGEKQTLTARSKYPSTINDLTVGTVQELRFDGDYVVGVKDISDSKIIDDYGIKWDDHEVYDVEYTGETLELKGRTLQSSGTDDEGLTIVSTSMPTVLGHEVNGEWETINYSSMAEALAAAGDKNPSAEGKQFDGRIVAVLNSQGVAQWAYIRSDVPVTTGSGAVVDGGDYEYYSYDYYVTGNGMGFMNFTVNRPAWLNYTTAGTNLEYQFDLYANGEFFDRVYSSDANAGAVAHNANSEPGTWDSGWPVLEPGTVLTIENFKYTNLDDQIYYIEYVDESGKVLHNGSWNPEYKKDTSEFSPVYRDLASAGATITFNLNSAKYVSGEPFSWSIDGVVKDAATAVLSGDTTVGGTNATTNADVKVAADRMDFIRVTIDMNSVASKYTVTGQTVDSLGDLVDGYAGLGANEDVKVELQQLDANGDPTGSAAGTQTVDSGKGVAVVVTLNSGALSATSGDGYGLVLTLDVKDADGEVIDTIEDVKFVNDGTTANQTVILDNIREDVTVEVSSVEALRGPTFDESIVDWADTTGNNAIDNGEVISITLDPSWTIDIAKVVSAGNHYVNRTLTGNTVTFEATSNATGTITFQAGSLKNDDGVFNTQITINVTNNAVDKFDVTYG